MKVMELHSYVVILPQDLRIANKIRPISFTLFVKSSNAANGIASMFFTILPFFSGIYFPLDFLPKPLRALAPFLPTTWIGDIMKRALGI